MIKASKANVLIVCFYLVSNGDYQIKRSFSLPTFVMKYEIYVKGTVNDLQVFLGWCQIRNTSYSNIVLRLVS